jgi:methanogenic corrinoid protein MtbC1
MPTEAAPVRNPSVLIAEQEYERYIALLLDGRRDSAADVAQDCLARGCALQQIYLGLFQRSQRQIGDMWATGRLTVAQEHYCTAATQLIMSIFYQHLFATPRIGRRLVATCVEDELHEVGVRIVADFFELAGWDTYYLGASVPPESVVSAILDRRAELLLISATMPAHRERAEALVHFVRASTHAGSIRIIVGGNALPPNDWIKSGADGYGYDAEDAVRTAHRMFGIGNVADSYDSSYGYDRSSDSDR